MKTTLLFLLLIACTGIPLCGSGQLPGNNFPPLGAGGPGQMPPQMSEEEMLRWQEEVDLEIAKFVSTLPPEEQEKFHKDVAELTEVMQNMSEKELENFISDVFVQDDVMAPVAQPLPVQEEPAPEKPELKPAVVEKPNEDSRKASALLNNLITRTERFLRKAQQIPGLSGKIEKWVEKDKVKEWQVGLTWETLRSKIDKLNQLFHTLLESRDPKTKQLRYVNDLVKSESLFATLNKLSSTLTKHEPKIEPGEFGLGTPAKGSHTAVKELLGAYAEAIYTSELIEELTKLIEKYEPRAKTLREEEESAKKKAYEDSKKQRTQSPQKVAVSPKAPRGSAHTDLSGHYGGNSGNFSSGYSQGTYGNYPQTNYADENYPSHHAGGDAGYAPTGGDYSRPSGVPSKGFIPGEEGKKESGRPTRGIKGGEQEGMSEKPGNEGKEQAPVQIQEDPDIMQRISNVEKSLEKVSDALEDNDNIREVAKYILKPANPLDVEMITVHMPALKRALAKAYTEVKTFKTKLNLLKKPEEVAFYNKRMKAKLADHKDALEKLAKQLNELTTDKRTVAGLTADKQYAYFGDQTKYDEAVKINPSIDKLLKGQPLDLYSVQKTVQDWKTITDDIK